MIDDEFESLKLIGLMLRRHGFEPLVASGAEQGIEMAENVQPDLILLDIMMPEIDGIEACRMLQENPKTNHIPIIVFTAKDGLEDRKASLDAGAVDFITKPINPNRLALGIRKVIAQD